jgi:hypothetical protein
VGYSGAVRPGRSYPPYFQRTAWRSVAKTRYALADRPTRKAVGAKAIPIMFERLWVSRRASYELAEAIAKKRGEEKRREEKRREEKRREEKRREEKRREEKSRYDSTFSLFLPRWGMRGMISIAKADTVAIAE